MFCPLYTQAETYLSPKWIINNAMSIVFIGLTVIQLIAKIALKSKIGNGAVFLEHLLIS